MLELLSYAALYRDALTLYVCTVPIYKLFVVKGFPLLKTEHCLRSRKRGRKRVEVRRTKSMSAWHGTHEMPSIGSCCCFVSVMSTVKKAFCCQCGILLSCRLILSERKWKTQTKCYHKQHSQLQNVGVVWYQEYFWKAATESGKTLTSDSSSKGPSIKFTWWCQGFKQSSFSAEELTVRNDKGI